MEQLDCIVIGAGPAGVSAALYLKRSGRRVAVIGKAEGALTTASLIENYYGLDEPISGLELLRRGHEQLRRLEIPFLQEEVVRIEQGFTVLTDYRVLSCSALILATGKARRKPPLEGLSQWEGKGVSYCAVCDGFFYRGKTVGVLGEGAYAMEAASYLRQMARQVLLFSGGNALLAAIPDGVTLVKDSLIRVRRDDSGLWLESDHAQHRVDGLFVAQGTANAMDFAKELGILIKDGSIATDVNMATNLPGCFAAGDCTGGLLQVASAVSQGAQAAFSVLRWLQKQK